MKIPTNFEFEISEIAFPLLQSIYDSKIIYRSAGIVLESFTSRTKEQLVLFDKNERREKNEKLAESIDKLETKFGRNVIRTGFINKNIPAKAEFLIKPNKDDFYSENL